MITPPEFTDEQREQQLKAIAEFTATMQALTQAMIPIMQAAAASFANLARAVQAAEQHDFALAPPRPAWQSPYGPPQKGHHQ